MLDAVTDEDVADVARALVLAAKGGDTGAARELLNRLVGSIAEAELAERIERLESMMKVS